MTLNNDSPGEPAASNTLNDAGPWKQRNLEVDTEIVARWLKRKQTLATATQAFKDADKTLQYAIEEGLLQGRWDDLANCFDYSDQGVILQRTERKSWPVSAYSEELQAQIKKEQETRSPNVSVFYRAKLTDAG